jgi:hypothetical protein
MSFAFAHSHAFDVAHAHARGVHHSLEVHAERRKKEEVRGLVGLRVVVGVALFLFRIRHGRAGQFVVAIVVARLFRILF